MYTLKLRSSGNQPLDKQIFLSMVLLCARFARARAPPEPSLFSLGKAIL